MSYVTPERTSQLTVMDKLAFQFRDSHLAKK